jgi:hypothetical protein
MSGSVNQDDIFEILARLERRVSAVEGGGGVVPIGQVSGAGLTSMGFPVIPQTFTHLRLYVIGQSQRSGFANTGLRFRLNSDTSTNYYANYISRLHSLPADSVNSGYTGAVSSGFLSPVPAGARATDQHTSFIVMDVPFYNRADVQKRTMVQFTYDDGSSQNAFGSVGNLWVSPSAISSLSIMDDVGGALGPRSVASLYGVS